MAPIIDGKNNDEINFFSLEEYVKRIKLEPYVLEHLEYTGNEFNEYLKQLSMYKQDYIINYWIYLLYDELMSNHAIENESFKGIDVAKKGLFFDTLTISHKRIHDLHSFFVGEDCPLEYRKTPVYVGCDTKYGEEVIWRAPKPEDVQNFMNDFVKIYKANSLSSTYSNPFLKSALIHLLFLRIHPYNDGNGRTARMIHNIKFTEMINRTYDMRLKISPLNLSKSILMNKLTYVNIIDNIYFDLEHDNNIMINKWFDFILNMADEQIYMSTNKLGLVGDNFLEDLTDVRKNTNDEIQKMRIRMP